MAAMFDQTLLRRVAVMPFALGGQQSSGRLVTNGGMSYIDSGGNDGGGSVSAVKAAAAQVHIHTLDEILDADAPIRLIK